MRRRTCGSGGMTQPGEAPYISEPLPFNLDINATNQEVAAQAWDEVPTLTPVSRRNRPLRVHTLL